MSILIRAGLAALLLWTPAGADEAKPGEIDFERTILPILSNNCFTCHGPDAAKRKGDLRLDDEKEAKKKNDEGRIAILPGKSAESEIIKRILTDDPSDRMPPAKANKTLTRAQIDLLRKWIDAGAPWGEHWAFRPLVKPEVPKGAANPIDAFIRARLERERLKPSPEADRTTLLRRVTLDLTGLPPAPEETAAFLADRAPDAYERAVDHLLASPRYGERMAWDWMEISRYADSNGYQGDAERTMWPWRDWVVKAFNENLPYDQFTIWQLAGDLLPEATREQKLATGFNRNHPINGEGGRISEENRVEYVMDMTETFGTVWLGLTLTCSRCHDHKFDPILKKDYFGLFAFFNQTPVNGGGGDPQTAPVLEMPTAEQTEKIAKLDSENLVALAEMREVEAQLLSVHEGPLAGKLESITKHKDVLKVACDKRSRQQFEDLSKGFEKVAPEYAKAAKKCRDLQDQRSSARKAVTRVMVMEDMPKPRKTYLLDKGLYDKRQDETSAGTPGKLPPLADDAPRNRLGLAKWLVSPEHPLTARVTVNRFWQMLFGIGLTKTSEDLGRQGEFPVHRELLDWLAADFRDSKWDVKRFLRQVVTSQTYRQSSRVTPEILQADPANRLLARGPRFRMASWMIRDQALAASGLLVDKPGGPSVNPYQPAGVWEETTFGNKRYKQDHGDALYRRSLYVFWRRIIGPTMFFDTTSRSTCTVKPTRTNTPLHALATLNDPTYVEAARALAERALEAKDDGARIDRAVRFVLGRGAKDEERKVLLSAVERLRREYAARPEDAKKLLKVGESKRNESIDPVEHAAWASLGLALLNLDETVTKE
jgi:mono/diheme cytochrome c family protein